jgi:hypothetical protein
MIHLACTVCGSSNVIPLIDIAGLPAFSNVLWHTRQDALNAPRGDIRLKFCLDCGHLFNASFEPSLADYAQDYDNSLHFSERFQAYASALADHLIERYQLRGKDIIEIGSGQGDFLKLLCLRGGNRGMGFDPSTARVPDIHTGDSDVVFVQDYYSERYAECAADFICCRHVLEHIDDPIDFIRRLRRNIGNRTKTIVYIEVPNALFILRDLSIWDIIYEHCSYFCRSSLTKAFASSGFRTCDTDETYDGQFLFVEALPVPGAVPSAPDASNDAERPVTYVPSFAAAYQAKIDAWQDRLVTWRTHDRRVVVWGAGSKGTSFLNTLKTSHQIEYVVDINPRKQGKFIAGTGQSIVPPDFLRDYRPDVVVVMNQNYEAEIRRRTIDLGLSVDLVCA